MKRKNSSRAVKTIKTITWEHLRPKVTEELLMEIAKRIVENFHPEKVVLFGSYAYGKPTIESDVDLLVIMKSNDRPAKRSAKVISVCRPRHLGMDVIVITPEELERQLAGFDPFLEEALSKGKVLYESTR
jgi:predicted nucleotidyltransferase